MLLKVVKNIIGLIQMISVNNDTSNGWIYPVFKCTTVNAESFSKNGKPIQFSSFGKNNRVKVALECNGIWFKENKFGVSWNVLQFLVGNVSTNEIEYSFRESDDENNEEELVSYDSEFTDIDY